MLTKYIKGEFTDQYNVTVGVEFTSKTIMIDEKLQVKLQIWDTVHHLQHRPDKSPSSPSPEATIARPQEPSSSTISPTASPSTTSLAGWNRPKSTEIAKWCLWSSETSATWNQSTCFIIQSQGHLRGRSQVRQR